MDLSYFQDYHKKVIDNCSKVIVGKEDVISLVLTCFVCSGHVLLEDIPGTGKTICHGLLQGLWAVILRGFSLHQIWFPLI